MPGVVLHGDGGTCGLLPTSLFSSKENAVCKVGDFLTPRSIMESKSRAWVRCLAFTRASSSRAKFKKCVSTSVRIVIAELDLSSPASGGNPLFE